MIHQKCINEIGEKWLNFKINKTKINPPKMMNNNTKNEIVNNNK